MIESDVVSSIPLYPAHKPNYLLVKSQPTEYFAWSLFCATQMTPKYDTPRFPPPADVSANNLLVKTDAPPAWSETFRRLPLIGNFLNVAAQGQAYFAVLENCVDVIAADLEKGLESEYIGKRVGVKERSKAQ